MSLTNISDANVNVPGTDDLGTGTINNDEPAVTITSAEADPTNNSPFIVSFSFDESVSSFVVGDVSVIGGTAGNFSTVSGLEYTADITPSGDGTVTIDVFADKANDVSGNGNLASNTYTITYDFTDIC